MQKNISEEPDMWNLKGSTNFDLVKALWTSFKTEMSRGCVNFRKENILKDSCCSFLLKSIQAVYEVVGKLHFQVLAGVLPTCILLEHTVKEYF